MVFNFSFENTMTLANSISLDEFINEETKRQASFVDMSQSEFCTAVDQYFAFEDHALSLQQLNEKRAQVIILYFLLIDLFICWK